MSPEPPNLEPRGIPAHQKRPWHKMITIRLQNVRFDPKLHQSTELDELSRPRTLRGPNKSFGATFLATPAHFLQIFVGSLFSFANAYSDSHCACHIFSSHFIFILKSSRGGPRGLLEAWPANAYSDPPTTTIVLNTFETPPTWRKSPQAHNA